MIPKVDWNPGRQDSATLQVHLLGLTDPLAAIAVQRSAVAEVGDRRDRYGVLLVCEHPPAVTVGRLGSSSDLLVDREALERRSVLVAWQRRGGGTWVHHPGQIVVYGILPVDRLGLTAAAFAERLEQAVVAVGQEASVQLQPAIDRPGGVGRCGQYGFVGAGLADGVSSFGVCVNVSVPPAVLSQAVWSQVFKPSCLAAERMRPMAMATARESLVRHLAAALGYDRYQVRTGHPQLRRSLRPVVLVPEHVDRY